MLSAVLVAPQAARAELADTLVRVKPAIVGVGTYQATRRPPGQFVGSGFVVADGRHAVTNAHNIPASLDTRNKEFLAILVQSGSDNVREAEVVARDDIHDLALLRFGGDRLPALTLADSRTVREGEAVAFTGFPIGIVLGMYPATHHGIVAAITPIAIPQLGTGSLDARMIRRLQQPYDVFQLDATAYPGNSGSPLYRPDSGAVIGVINKVFVKESKEKVLEKPSGISYAIPSEYVQALLSDAGL